MTATLQLDEDIARRLNDQAKRERTNLDTLVNRILRRSVLAAPPVDAGKSAWLEELRALRESCATGKPGTPVEHLIDEIRN